MANCSDAHGTYGFLLPDANDNTVKALALFITLREEELISKLIDTLDIKAIKDIGWLCLGDTAINTDCIPEIIYDLAEKYLSYKPA